MSVPDSERSREQTWGLPIPWFQDTKGDTLRLTLARPSWFTMIFFLGLASLSRCLLTQVGHLNSTWISPVYLVCLAVALLIGQLIEKIRGPQVGRILSATLGAGGFTLTALTSVGPKIAPVAAVATVFVLTLAGELLYWRFADSRGGELVYEAKRVATA